MQGEALPVDAFLVEHFGGDRHACLSFGQVGLVIDPRLGAVHTHCPVNDDGGVHLVLGLGDGQDDVGDGDQAGGPAAVDVVAVIGRENRLEGLSSLSTNTYAPTAPRRPA